MADGNRDGNRGELWRTLANLGGREASDLCAGRTLANYGELKNGVLKTTKVQAFGGSNPSPSARSIPPKSNAIGCRRQQSDSETGRRLTAEQPASAARGWQPLASPKPPSLQPPGFRFS